MTASPSTTPSGTTLSDTTTSSAASFGQRLQRLEDLEEIRTLTARYAHAVDKGLNGAGVDLDALPEIFTADATWTSAASNAHAEGIEAIVDLLQASTADYEFAMHSFTNPVITVDGDIARAKWLLWVAIAGNEVFQGEDLVYARTSDGWRIKTLDLHFGRMLNS